CRAPPPRRRADRALRATSRNPHCPSAGRRPENGSHILHLCRRAAASSQVVSWCASCQRVRDVTDETYRRVALLRTPRIEARSVRIHLERAEHGVTLHALVLPVTAGTALESLTRRLAMTQQPQRLRIVEPRTEPAGHLPGAHPARIVTGRAEQPTVVTARALEPAGICLCRMSRNEVRWMEPAGPRPSIPGRCCRRAARRDCIM